MIDAAKLAELKTRMPPRGFETHVTMNAKDCYELLDTLETLWKDLANFAELRKQHLLTSQAGADRIAELQWETAELRDRLLKLEAIAEAATLVVNRPGAVYSPGSYKFKLKESLDALTPKPSPPVSPP